MHRWWCQLVEYATVALDKSGLTLRNSFDTAVGKYVYPLRMRADMAFEATFVE